MSTFNINLHETIYSLSDALDLVGVNQVNHGKRVAYMAAECGKAMDWPVEQIDDYSKRQYFMIAVYRIQPYTQNWPNLSGNWRRDIAKLELKFLNQRLFCLISRTLFFIITHIGLN